MSLQRLSMSGYLLLAPLLLAAGLLAGCASGTTRTVAPQPPAADTAALHTADADNDSVPDALDECERTPENVAVDTLGCPVTLYLRLTVPHAGGMPDSPEQYNRQMARIARLMRQNPDSVLRIEGHSAPEGSSAIERERSLQWAQSARYTLQTAYNILPSRLEASGMGAAMPLVSNSTADGRSRNQRLELTLQGHYSSRSEPSPEPANVRHKPLPRQRMQAAAPPEMPEPQHLRFAYGGTDLLRMDQERLETLGWTLQQHPDVRVHLVGHTDSKGTAGFNMKLSRRRAEQVRDMLVMHYGIDSARISTEGKGESAPIASNDTEQGRLANRRVSVTLIRPGQQARPTASTASRSEYGNSHTSEPTYAQQASTVNAQARTFREIPRVKPGSSAPVALDPNKQYLVKISIERCKLWLYEKLNGGAEKLVRSYDVATPKPGTPGPQGMGYVTRIDFNPWWVPTENLKRAALRKGRRLPDQVRPGSSSNPMGKFKIHLSHGEALRIHGTNKPHLIGRRVSAGCIRMRNDQGLEMAHAINEGTEVLVVE